MLFGIFADPALMEAIALGAAMLLLCALIL